MDLSLRHLALVKTADGRYGLQPAAAVQDGIGEGHGGSPTAATEEGDGGQWRSESSPSPRWGVASPQPGQARTGGYATPQKLQAWGGAQESLGSVSAQRAGCSRVSERFRFADEERLALSSDRLRGRLLEVSSSFQTVDRKVEDDAKRRRELEQQQVREVTSVLERLQKMLSTETAKREEAAKESRQAIHRHVETMISGVQSRMLERFGRLSKSVESLCERCSIVERGIQQFRGELPTKLQVESASLKHAIRGLSATVDSDRKARVEEDARLMRTIEEVESGLDSRLQQELAQLEWQMEALQELIDDFTAGEESEEMEKYRASVLLEIDALQDDLANEARAREHADDQVVQAINAYASTLHRSILKAST
mmetsp:Transcript_110419/g.235859  ORF Transcript_110419/g.235859 Transcript_110419/m.235859 type:complete len:369 (+) Transcript_110419:123-1229(+)